MGEDIAIFAQDITEQKLAKDALREREENRKNIPVLILSLTPISADKIKSPNTKFTLSDTSYMASASDYRPYCVVHHNGEAA
jgi:hypothetical protein